MNRMTEIEARMNKKVVVAVLDTGVFVEHPKLARVVGDSKTFVQNQPTGQFQAIKIKICSVDAKFTEMLKSACGLSPA